MGFSRFRFALNVMIQPSTAGGPSSTYSYVTRGSDRFNGILWDPICGSSLWVENFGTPPWGESPFTLHFFETGTLLPPKGYYRRRSDFIRALGVSQNIPFPIFDAPPTTEPVEVGKMFDPLQEYIAYRRRTRAFMALRATSDAPGRWNAFLNATEYQADSCKILGEAQAHTLLPNDSGLTWDLWSQAEVLGYLNQRLSKFIKETGCLRKRYTASLTSSTVDLPSDVMEIRRVVWNGVGLYRTEQQQLDYGRVGWDTESGTPVSYIEEPQASLSITLVPAPSVSGTVDILYVPKPAEITSACVRMPVPNFMASYVKWGVLADMLKKEGPANEPQRAGYAEGRFGEGVQLVKLLMGKVA